MMLFPYQAFRPDARPVKFAGLYDYKIRGIRAFARRLAKGSAQNPPTDQQIIFCAFKAGLLKRKPKLLEFLSETELMRIWRWLGTQIFQQGYDDYYKEMYSGQ